MREQRSPISEIESEHSKRTSRTSAAAEQQGESWRGWQAAVRRPTSCLREAPPVGSTPDMKRIKQVRLERKGQSPCAGRRWQACSLQATPCSGVGGFQPDTQPRRTWIFPNQESSQNHSTNLELSAMAGWAASCVRFRKAARLNCSSMTKACSSSLNLLAKNLFLISKKFPFPTSIWRIKELETFMRK